MVFLLILSFHTLQTSITNDFRLVLNSKDKNFHWDRKKIDKKYTYVFGIPSGGILPAHIIAEEIGAEQLDLERYSELKNDSKNSILVVDDLVDSGNTLTKYNPHFTEASENLEKIKRIKNGFLILLRALLKN